MKKILLFVSVIGLSSLSSFGQQDAQYTQNMFNRLLFNPAYAGSGGGICGTAMHRQQWVGFGGGPQTSLLVVDAPVKRILGGVGLTFQHDQLGNESTNYIKIAYAFRQAIGPGIASAGVDAGMLQKSIGASWSAPDGTNGVSDGSIPQQASDAQFDIGFGLHYQIPGQFYAGISALHLNAAELQDVNLSYKLARNYYITAGYQYDGISPDISLRPSVFVKTDFASTQLDINCLAYYQNQFWAGLSYRTVDAISPMVGFQGAAGPNGNYRIGYAYDLTTSQVRTKSGGSHEIMVGYCYIPQKKFKVTKYKNVRFL